MEYCHFHPLSSATFYCDHCLTNLCDHCVDDSQQRGGERCISCAKQLISLGAAHSAEPFWRKLKEAFHYPLNGQSLTLIIGVALMTSVAAFIPFAIVFYLMAVGALMRYSFACLENTANGKMTAPDITEAYEGGVLLIFQLIGIVVIMTAAVFGVNQFLGEGLARLLAVFCILSFPAIIILFALNRNMFDAVNPLSIIQLILSVGLSYGVLLGLILVMSASVSVIHELIGAEFSFINALLQGIVSNFYTIVAFHIMGYMIFQYQAELGFVAREDHGGIAKGKSEQDLHNAKIDIALKLGHYSQVVDLFGEANKKFPNEYNYYIRCFDFLCATKQTDRLEKFLPFYFDFLPKAQRADQIYPSFKRALGLIPSYLPTTAKLRHQLAEQCQIKGDPKSALRMLNGIHKHFPSYAKLPAAYEVMERALGDIPNMDKQRAQCKLLIQSLKQKSADAEAAKQAAQAILKPKSKPMLGKSALRPSKEITAESPQSQPLRKSEQQKLRAQQLAEKNAKGDLEGKDLPPIEFKP
ncbi:hypothetical protein R50072_36460 [Simiduia litorea]|uniref:hypothetical protein n=1 Tax=Simiduia litorea TaxID=1435348 RepID=UPI0036F283AD